MHELIPIDMRRQDSPFPPCQQKKAMLACKVEASIDSLHDPLFLISRSLVSVVFHFPNLLIRTLLFCEEVVRISSQKRITNFDIKFDQMSL